MTVFRVFFLFFVLWVDHSHGRAYETESIFFNNTQLPYEENINPGTVISSKSVPYDSFYLVFLWQNSRCNSRRIPRYQPFEPNQLVLHGLWPQQTRLRRSIECDLTTCTNPFYYREVQYVRHIISHIMHVFVVIKHSLYP